MSEPARTPWSIGCQNTSKNWTDSAGFAETTDPLAARLLQDIIAELEADLNPPPQASGSKSDRT
ncbi:hypothetical protein BSZ19_03780 [Bradyrhizobium japonicum]|uniref:Uncharacterized protein n=1 Tax=Bradyrhizobium japonicum TaxID=375 RepID=A0A1Y2JY28_BRAJP|nr:hypothetical protein BSZ19_03780 [Bradyrhizobium japonicum]